MDGMEIPMTPRVCWSVTISLVIFWLFSISHVWAATAGIPAFIQPITLAVQSFRAVAVLIGTVLFIVAALQMARSEGAGLVTLFFSIFAVGVAVYSQEIMATVFPGAAASTLASLPDAPALEAVIDMLVDTLIPHLCWRLVRYGQRTRRI